MNERQEWLKVAVFLGIFAVGFLLSIPLTAAYLWLIHWLGLMP